MSFKLSGPPTKDDIKVAYIDPKLGLVEGVSICQANEYALKEPGTTFIFRDGKQTLQYLNINEVNTIDPIILTTTDECGGISEKVECGPPTIQIFGGGGIGAAGNPIVGNDGSILAVDIVRGGNGYQYPPLVAARDVCNNGSGATFVSVIGEVVETTETFENEADFEEYEICEPTDVGYGQNWGPNGEDLGSWDPKTYTEPGEDPIRKEVGEFEELVRNLARSPYWSTRKNKPTKVTSSDTKIIPSEYNVTFPAWNEFMNSYAISPVSPSNVRGSDFAGRLFTYEWSEDFPVDGEYIFRGLCDNQAQLYFDNLKIADLASFADSVIPIQKTITKGLHNIRVDLLNVPITETVTRQSPTPPSESIIDVNFNFIGNRSAANTHNYKINELGIDIFKPRKTSLNKNVTGKAESGKVYEVEFYNNGSPGGTIIQRNDSFIEYEDGGGNTLDASINIDKGKFLNVRGNKCSFVVGEPIPPAPPSPPSPNSPIQVKKVFNTLDYISKANRTLWRTNVNGKGGFINEFGICPFDTSVTLTDNPYAGTHTIVWNNINFPVDGSYRIRMGVDDSVTLFIGDERIRYEGFIAGTNTSNPEYNVNKFFKAGNYTVRAELEQIPGGVFGFSDVRNANPMVLAIDIEVTTVTENIISAKSWNENPMGLALTIDAPEPPIPQEPILEQEGRCPNNPIWTTRFPSIAGYGYNDASGSAEVLNNRYNVPDVFGAANDIPSYKSQGFTDADIRNYLETVYKFIPGKIIGGAMQDLLNDPTWGQPTPGVPLKTIYNLETNVASPISNFRSSNSSGWFPVRHPAWADFFNRYAISPIRPLDTPGTDGGGIVFRNYWDIDIPYDGFYQFAVQRDNTARFYVDGTLAFDIKSSGDELWKDKRNKPKFQKVFITKGRHVISVELENETTEAYDQVNQKIFRTLDWQVSLPASSPQSTTIDVNFNFIGNSSAANTHNYKITELGIDIFKPRKTGLNQNITKNCVSGQVYEVEFFNNGSPGGTIIQRNDSFIEYEDGGGNTLDASINIDKGKFLNVRGNKCSFVVGEPIPPAPITGGLTGGTSRDGVTYEGPALASYRPGLLSPFFENTLTPTEEIQGKTWIMTWRNVDFPEDGKYNLTALADDLVIVRVDGVEVGRAKVFEDRRTFLFNATKGKKSVQLELSNIRTPNTGFNENPVVTFVEINKNVSVLREGSGKSWDENPIGVGAILIPPPCPRKISGKGVVTDIIPTSPGNGYLPPVSPLPPPPSTVSVTPSDVPGAAAGAPGAGVAPPGAGVGPPDADVGVSPTIITVVPPSGAPTGINARFIPQFEVVRDPIVVNPQQLLQVTDLVGLKQTGYVNGRPYYGSVYYDRGIRYAGFYETVGEPVRVYDTLRESITAQVTTSPSAILRQGTDIRSNDPLLNIPGTVQSTLSSNSIVGAGDISTPSVPFTQEPVQDPIYPVSLRLKRVLVQDRGINYNVTDKIRVIPSNGAILEPIFGSFGRVVKVAVIDPGFGFTEYPRIEMYTPL
jgi:hypothetical protein